MTKTFHNHILPPLARAGSNLAGLTTARTALVHDTLVLGAGADVLERRGVSVVLVDAHNLAAVLGRQALDVDVPLALGLAVAAGSVDLAVVFDVEVDDVDGAAAVLLEGVRVSMLG